MSQTRPTATQITYQSPISNSVPVKEQVLFIPTPQMFGAVGDGVTDDTAALQSFITNVTNPVIQGTYLISSTLTFSNVGANKQVTLRNATISVNSSATNSCGAFEFDGVTSGFRLIGDKNSKIIFVNVPTVRTSHAVLIQGATITDCEIGGFQIVNSPNMNVWVNCGLTGTVTSGSNNIRIHDMELQNSLGDGVHVQNADSDVKIWDITGNGIGDDGIAVINYTGATYATHSTQTKNVSIRNVNLTNCHTSLVAFAGVTDYIVEASGTSYPNATTIAFKCAQTSNYTVGNSNGIVDIVGDGFAKMAAFDTPGAVTPTNGTPFNRDCRGRIRGTNVTNTGLYASNSGVGGDNAIAGLQIELNISASVDGVFGMYIGNTTDCIFGDCSFYGLSGVGTVANNSNFRIKNLKFRSPSATCTYGAQFTGNTNIKIGTIDISDTKATPTLKTGLLFQSNTGVVHEGFWSVSNAITASYAFGSNTNVQGFFYSKTLTYIGGGATSGAQTGATAGTQSTVPYPDTVPTGAGFLVQVSVASNESLRWGFKNAVSNQLTMLWTDTMTAVYTYVTIQMFAA